MRPSPESDLLNRLRALLRSERATEAELRAMSEQSAAWARALQGQIESSEQRLDELEAHDGLLAEIANELRRLESARNELAKLERFRRDLADRAHELRAEWLGASREAP